MRQDDRFHRVINAFIIATRILAVMSFIIVVYLAADYRNLNHCLAETSKNRAEILATQRAEELQFYAELRDALGGRHPAAVYQQIFNDYIDTAMKADAELRQNPIPTSPDQC
jgi:hypothetical protein